MTPESIIQLITQIGFPIVLILAFLKWVWPKLMDTIDKNSDTFVAELKEQRENFRTELKEQRENHQVNIERFFTTQTNEHQRIEDKITDETNKIVDVIKEKI